MKKHKMSDEDIKFRIKALGYDNFWYEVISTVIYYGDIDTSENSQVYKDMFKHMIENREVFRTKYVLQKEMGIEEGTSEKLYSTLKFPDEVYKKLDIRAATDLDVVIKELEMCHAMGQKVFASFNGHALFSDTITVDGAYLRVTGMTKEEYDKECMRP